MICNYVETPIGLLKTKIKTSGDFPCIETWLCDFNGNDIECISVVEYNKKEKCIAGYLYKENESDYSSKIIFKEGVI